MARSRKLGTSLGKFDFDSQYLINLLRSFENIGVNGFVLERFNRHIASAGLRRTRQRELITRVFLDTKGHISVEELHRLVKRANPGIGFATVYRTMRLLTEAGLAKALSFGDGRTRYEVSGGTRKHHGHLICTACGKVVEFENERIEQLQENVARLHGFTVTDHKLELYGQCATCASRSRTAAPKGV